MTAIQGGKVADGNELTTDTPAVVSAAPSSTDLRYDKVGGWLLFFCVTLVVVNPLATVLLQGYGALTLLPLVGDYPVVGISLALDAVLGLSVAGLSVYAGVKMWQRRPGAVKLAKTFLFAGVAYTIVAPLLWLIPGVPRDPSVSILDILLSSWRGLLYYAIWLNYLRTSKRVAATYTAPETPA